MSEPQSAPQSAVHSLPGPEERHAQTRHARTRDSVTDGTAKVVDLTERSRARFSRRWGKPIEEPPASKKPSAAAPVSIKAQDALNHLHVWRDPTPSLRAVWADLKDGSSHAFADGGIFLAVPYWALGLIAFPIVVAAKHIEIVFARPGRTAGLIVLALLIGGALLIAKLNATP